jgi:hypothetical protein
VKRRLLIGGLLLFLMMTASASASMQVFTERTIKGQFNGAYSVHAADGDRDVEALGAAQEDSDITWWENDGQGDFTEHAVGDSLDGARSVYVADLDADDDMDLLGSAGDLDSIAQWVNDGSQDSASG